MLLDDRRRYVRIPCRCVFSFSVVRRDGTPVPGRTGYVRSKNFSLGGMLFSAFDPLEKGSLLCLNIPENLLSSSDECIRVLGSVIRCEEISQAEEGDSGRLWDIAVALEEAYAGEKAEAYVKWLCEKDEDDYYIL